MSKKKLGLGVAIVAAFCVSAFTAASASALSITPHNCTTAVGTGNVEYENATCTVAKAGGKFEKVPFVKLTGISVTKPSTYTLASTNGGLKFKISCTGLAGEGTLEDVGEAVNGSGIVLTYSGCTVTEPVGKLCQVKAGGGANGTIITNKLKSVTTRTAAEAYKTVFTPVVAPFVTINVNSCTVAALNGEKEVKGSATSVAGADGMLFSFTATSGSELTFGGQAATLLGSNEAGTPGESEMEKGAISFGA